MNIKDYTPIDGFVDLRNFKLSAREFKQIWRIQQFFRRMQNSREYHKKYNLRQWQEVIVCSAEVQMFLMERIKPGHEYE